MQYSISVILGFITNDEQINQYTYTFFILYCDRNACLFPSSTGYELLSKLCFTTQRGVYHAKTAYYCIYSALLQSPTIHNPSSQLGDYATIAIPSQWFLHDVLFIIDVFHFHFERRNVANVFLFWVFLSKEQTCQSTCCRYAKISCSA